MAITGFSLPQQDDYARQILHSLVTNYQRHAWGQDFHGKTKSPLAIVDYFTTDKAEQDFRKRYQFVDWERATLDTGGFDLDTLEAIFA